MGTERRMVIQPVVGNTVDGRCASCKLILAHTIQAIVKTRLHAPIANTCGAQHAYRRNAPGATGRASSGGRQSATAASAPVDYRELLHGKKVETAREYKTSERLQPKEIIHHLIFGLGIVVAVRDANKVDVGFNDGLKTLIHGGSSRVGLRPNLLTILSAAGRIAAAS